MAIPYSRIVVGTIPWYSALIVGGMVLAVWLAGREERRVGLPKDTAIDLALILIPCGVIGARLYYVAMTWELFRDHPVSALYIWEGGLAIYGGVIGGVIGAWVYARRKGIAFSRLADIVAPGLILAQAIGRWGNYFNMEAYGPLIADERFQFFPLGVLIPTGEAWEWHMATFFYESVWDFAGFCALWGMRRRVKESGSLFCWYLLIYGSGRFIIERLREDSLYLAGLRVSQVLSLALCAAAAAVLLMRALRGGSRQRGVALACEGAWLGRWFCLSLPWGYAALMAVGLAGATWLCAGKRGATLWRLGGIVAVDALGLLCLCLGMPFSAAFAGHVAAVACSATLPAYVAVVCACEEMGERG